MWQMKIKQLRKLIDEELLKYKKELEFNLMKAKYAGGRDRIKQKDVKIKIQKKGQKTKLTKDIRRTIAKINTILKERENDIKKNE